jgi:hypothetical protein
VFSKTGTLNLCSSLRVREISYTVRSLINRSVTVTCRLTAGTGWLTAKRYKIFSDTS